MDQNYFSFEESNRIIKLYQQLQDLKNFQIQQLTKEIVKHKDQIKAFCFKAYCFLDNLNNLIPYDNQLRKKAEELKWIKIYLDDQKMQYWFHRDYFTYCIYNKICTQRITSDQQQQLENIIGEFENRVISKIGDLNFIFVQNLLQRNPYYQNIMRQQIDNLQLHQTIEYIQDLNDILTDEDLKTIQSYMKITMLDLIEKEQQNVKDLIKKQYQGFLTSSEIPINNNLPQNFNFNDFGNGLSALKLLQKQNSIQKIDESLDLNQLKKGVYYIKKNESLIIIEINQGNNINTAYIINELQHIKIKLQIPEGFSVYHLRTIRLEIEELYTLIKYLKKKKLFIQQQNQTLEYYNQRDFEMLNDELMNQIKIYNITQDKINQCIKKVINETNSYKDIYSLKFVEEFQKKNKSDFDIIQCKEFDSEQDKYKYKEQILGEILTEKQQKNLLGVVVYLNRTTIIIFLKKGYQIKEKDLNNSEKYQYFDGQSQEHQQKINQIEQEDLIKPKVIQTNVKDIQVQVAQFYVSLLLYKQENNISKQIKDFLELKNSVWGSILKFLV